MSEKENQGSLFGKAAEGYQPEELTSGNGEKITIRKITPITVLQKMTGVIISRMTVMMKFLETVFLRMPRNILIIQ